VALRVISRSTATFKMTGVTAPTVPLSSEVSLPMTAFCTTLGSRKIATKSEGQIGASQLLDDAAVTV
jgi:hypothetical protein